MRTPGSSGQQSWSLPAGCWSWWLGCQLAIMGLLASGLADLSLPVPPLRPGPGRGSVTVLRPFLPLVAGPVLALVAVDRLPSGPPGPPLSQVAGRLGANSPLGVAELVAVAVAVQPGGGLPPGPPPPTGLGDVAEETDEPSWRVELQGSAGGPGAPAELGHHRPIAVAGGLMTLQEPGALLLLLAAE